MCIRFEYNFFYMEFHSYFDKDVLNISQNKKELNIEIQQPFYIEHLLKKRDKDKKKNKSLSYKTTQNSFRHKLKHLDLDLPFVNEKIIFSKGETEKLLNYQFYNSSYKACCETNKPDSVNNLCIKKNYNNNWNYVRQYTNDRRRKNRKLMEYN